jgi:hypothetical protein
MKKLEKIWVDNPTNKCYNNKALDESECKDSNLKRLSEKKKSEAEAETEWEQVGVKEAEGELEKRKFKKLLKKAWQRKETVI